MHYCTVLPCAIHRVWEKLVDPVHAGGPDPSEVRVASGTAVGLAPV